MSRTWAGIDAGKTHHHCVVLDDEPELLQLIADVLALGDEVTWAIDLADGGAALKSVLSR